MVKIDTRNPYKSHHLYFLGHSMLDPITPACLGVNRGDHISWPLMEKIIPTMMMMNMSTYSIPTSPIKMSLFLQIIQAHHIQSTHYMGDGKPTLP
jgi:hypothetical protein